MRLVIHVDDGAVSGPANFLQDFVNELREKVKITFSTEVKDFTGLCIDYDLPKGHLMVHLKTCIEDAVRRFRKYIPTRVYASRTPLPTGTQFLPATDEEHSAAKHLPYQELVGCLVWITVRALIQAATAVSMLGSHAAKWNSGHRRNL